MRSIKTLATNTIKSRRSKQNMKRLKDIVSANFKVVDHRNENTDFGKCWLSKIDGHYLCHDIDNMLWSNYNFLLRYDIYKLLTHSLGFSTKSQKWYGWSHRALAGFTVGDLVKKGHVAYKPSNKVDFEESCIDWVSHGVDEEYGTNVIIKSITKDIPNPDGYYTYYTYEDNTPLSKIDEHASPVPSTAKEVYHEADQDILGINIVTITKFFGAQEGRNEYESNHWYEYPTKFGKGTYKIMTLEEAKQTAIIFAGEVS